MKVVLCFLALAGVALAGPRFRRQAPQEPIPILSFVNENNYDGSYKYSYETGNGISVSEEGVLKNAGAGEDAEAQSASGSYSYTAPNGLVVTVQWTSDETGYHPKVSYSQG